MRHLRHHDAHYAPSACDKRRLTLLRHPLDESVSAVQSTLQSHRRNGRRLLLRSLFYRAQQLGKWSRPRAGAITSNCRDSLCSSHPWRNLCNPRYSVFHHSAVLIDESIQRQISYGRSRGNPDSCTTARLSLRNIGPCQLHGGNGKWWGQGDWPPGLAQRGSRAAIRSSK